MKNRFLALLLALMMVLSVFLMTACKKEVAEKADDEDGSSENLSEREPLNLDTATPQQQFAYNLIGMARNAHLPQAVRALQKLNDTEFAMQFRLDKLTTNGMRIIDGKPVDLTAALQLDLDNLTIGLSADGEVLGDDLSASALINSDGLYLLDVMDVNEKPIFFSFEKMGINAEMSSMLTELFAQYEELLSTSTSLVDLVSQSLDVAASAGDFVSVRKDVSVGDTSFSNAAVTTLTLTPETIADALMNLLDEMKEDPVYSEFISLIINNLDYDRDTARDELIRELKQEGLIDITVDSILSAESETLAMYFNVHATDGNILAKIEYEGDNWNFGFGSTQDDRTLNYEIINVAYTLNGPDERFSVVMQNEEILSLTATKNADKHEGVLTLQMNENDFIAINYTFEGDLFTEATLITHEITYKEQGIVSTFPVTFGLSWKFSETEVALGARLAVDLGDMFAIDATIGLTQTLLDLDLDAPANHMDIEEITPSHWNEWMEKLQNKIPKIMEFIESIEAEFNETVMAPSLDQNDYLYSTY